MFKKILVLCMFVASIILIDSLLSGGGNIIFSALIIGPLRDFKWAGIPLNPTKDGEAEVKQGGFEYEGEMSSSGEPYATAAAVLPYVQQECVMTQSQYDEFIDKQDGVSRAGTATMANGDVVSMNCFIDGEHILTGGKITVKLSGKVRVQ